MDLDGDDDLKDDGDDVDNDLKDDGDDDDEIMIWGCACKCIQWSFGAQRTSSNTFGVSKSISS